MLVTRNALLEKSRLERLTLLLKMLFLLSGLVMRWNENRSKLVLEKRTYEVIKIDRSLKKQYRLQLSLSKSNFENFP